MTALPSYPTYKDSGMEWLGDVPEHWETRRLRSVLAGVTKRNRPDLPLLSVVREKGVILRDISDSTVNHNYIPDDLSNYKLVRSGWFAINKMKAWQGSFGVSAYDGIVSPAYHIYTLAGVESDFFHVAIRSSAYVPYFSAASDGVRIGQWDLSATRMRDIPFVVPTKPEQIRIARFLDDADRRIRRYIRAKERLIELLEEEGRATIHEAVTGRIDVRTGQPYPAYKDSGVEWLGEVPEHWEVRRLKTLCDMRSGDTITAMSIDEVGKYRVFGGNGIRGYSSEYTHDGDYVLIGRQGALCGNVHIARGRFWASEHAVVATLHCGHVLDWFGAALETMNLNQYSIAAAQPGLSVDRVLHLWVPVPLAHEQGAIARFLTAAGRRLSARRVSLARQIALLREYRTRLIADVVTGKLDVREAAADLPETIPLAADRDRPDVIPTEPNLHSTERDVMKKAIP